MGIVSLVTVPMGEFVQSAHKLTFVLFPGRNANEDTLRILWHISRRQGYQSPRSIGHRVVIFYHAITAYLSATNGGMLLWAVSPPAFPIAALPPDVLSGSGLGHDTGNSPGATTGSVI